MKSSLSLIFLMLLVISAQAQTLNPNYDSTLAKTLGADDYGKKMYVMAIVKAGSNTTQDKAILDSLIGGHRDYLNMLTESGKLVFSGPFGQNETGLRGILLFNVSSLTEAAELLKPDPAFKGNLLLPELFPWYGPAALPVYLEASEKIWKKQP
jgi:uncharacterized protein YciI